MSWHNLLVKVLKANEIRLVTYIPDIDGEKPAGVTDRDPVRIRSRFMDALSGKG